MTLFVSRPHGQYVQARWQFSLSNLAELEASAQPLPGGDFADLVFYRTYSREVADRKERWVDVVIRVIQGVMSIRLDHHTRYRNQTLPVGWDAEHAQQTALRMAKSLMLLEWCPPGRGLFAMGTDWVYNRGSMALFNCGATEVRADYLADDIAWLMDALMCGVGVGAGITPALAVVAEPLARSYYQDHVIGDSREGWVESVWVLIQAELGRGVDRPCYHPRFDYTEIRKKGSILHGIGGRASGYEVLEQLHHWIRESFARYRTDNCTTRLLADLTNQVGACVSMGDVRRSAEILLGDPDDDVFWDLKNYEIYPEREEWGWASNNSLRFRTRSSFEAKINRLALSTYKRAEPGALLLFNFGNDPAQLANPCGEVPLEHRELCNVVETFPGRCDTVDHMIEAAEHATFYACTVALLPTHHDSTNAVLGRNRRIGVSLVGIAAWEDKVGEEKLRGILRRAYRRVRATSRALAYEANIPYSIRTTTLKPGGTVPKLAGEAGGISRPTARFMLRRIRIGIDDPVRAVLEGAGYQGLVDEQGARDVLVYEIPMKTTGRTESEVDFLEQAALLVRMQEVWSDNAVSCTLYFNEGEFRRGEVATALGVMAHSGVKSLALALNFDPETSVYKLCPEEKISEDEWNRRRALTRPLNWSQFHGTANPPKFCDGPTCAV